MRDMKETITLYQKCFAEAPWFEVFDPKELSDDFWVKMRDSTGVFLVCERDGKIVGGAIGFDLVCKEDVRMRLIDYSIDHHSFEISTGHAFYIAELFVDSSLRGQGIAKRMAGVCLEFARDNGYRMAVVRTSLEQTIIQHLFIDGFGFKPVARQAILATKCIDGVTEELAYTSVIMAGAIASKSMCEH